MIIVANKQTGALADAFVRVADTLIDDYDVIDVLDRLAADCVGLLGVNAAGIMLFDQRNKLHVVASSTERTRMLELFQLQADQGPCLDCFRTGRPVSIADLAQHTKRWPRFTERAIQDGFHSAHGLPLRLRSTTIGALNLFDTEPGPIPVANLRIGQALADVATIGILQERALRSAELLSEQLQTALNTRVIIEQAKGVLAERNHLDMAEAFTALRSHARDHNQRLSDVARSVIDTSGELGAPPDPPA